MRAPHARGRDFAPHVLCPCLSLPLSVPEPGGTGDGRVADCGVLFSFAMIFKIIVIIIVVVSIIITITTIITIIIIIL